MLPRFLRSLSCLTFVLAVGITCIGAKADVTLLGVQYRPDRPFPEHECLWHTSEYPGPCGPSEPLGGSLHMFLLNTGPTDVTVEDVLLAGESLNECLVRLRENKKRVPASIWYPGPTDEQRQILVNAGEPIWYKAHPVTLTPGTAGQVIIRLRQPPVTPSVQVGVVCDTGLLSAEIPIDANMNRLASVSFSKDLTKVYLYWRRTPGGITPSQVLMDGIDVTDKITQDCDANFDVCPSVLQLDQPLIQGSYHVFQGIYPDGETISAGLRTWGHEACYGMWGAWRGAGHEEHIARAYIEDVTDHMVNTQVVSIASPAVQEFIKKPEGQQFAADHGLDGFVIQDVGKWKVQHPYLYFIWDEPDCKDAIVGNDDPAVRLPEGKQIGALSQMLAERADMLRSGDPDSLTMLNLNMAYAPHQWYVYGQVPDVMGTDPYYQARMRYAFYDYPDTIPLYSKATYIYGVSQLAQAGCEPNPLHVILYACKYMGDPEKTFPYPTPQSKRIEVYYAMAGGAKGFSYWWYSLADKAHGVGAAMVEGDPDAIALWHEMGLLGAEVRTLGPVLVNSCPAEMPIQASPGLWVRSLVSGLDTLVLLAVNDNYYNDEQGCHYDPLDRANLILDVPSWMQAPEAFEMSAAGPRNIYMQNTDGQLKIDLGTVDVTRMIVITCDSQLRTQLQDRYEQQFQAKVCKLDDIDTDSDGMNDACDICPNDPLNIDSDGDGICDNVDTCPNDPLNDNDADDICGDEDTCPNDPENDKDEDGICGDVDNCPNDPLNDSDDDGTCDDVDECPDDPDKAAKGVCGCAVTDTDTDKDGTPNCNDECPDDADKTEPGTCGCGSPDIDSDGDGVFGCSDNCPDDANKAEPGICGCGIADTDMDTDGILDCNDNCPRFYNPDQADIDADGVGDACDPLNFTTTGNPISEIIPNCGFGLLQTLIMSFMGFLMLHAVTKRNRT